MTDPTQSMLSNLLARIHRDGGHYEAEHGTEKAVTDADDKIAALYAAMPDPTPRVIGDEPVARPPSVQAAFEVFADKPDTGPHATAMFRYIEQLEAMLTASPSAALIAERDADNAESVALLEAAVRDVEYLRPALRAAEAEIAALKARVDGAAREFRTYAQSLRGPFATRHDIALEMDRCATACEAAIKKDTDNDAT